MDKNKDSMKGMTSAQKAAVLRGKQRTNKDEMEKNDPRKTPLTGLGTKAEFDRRNEIRNKLSQGNVDIGRTIARLDSQESRGKRAAVARLAKMRAENKARKAARKAGKMDPDAQPGFKPAPFLTKNNKKKDKK